MYPPALGAKLNLACGDMSEQFIRELYGHLMIAL